MTFLLFIELNKVGNHEEPMLLILKIGTLEFVLLKWSYSLLNRIFKKCFNDS